MRNVSPFSCFFFGPCRPLLGLHVRTRAQAENFHRDALRQRRKAGASGTDDLAPFCYNLALVLGTNARKGPIANLEKGQREVKGLICPRLTLLGWSCVASCPRVACVVSA